ncbi:MAG: ribonuclease R, partial [Defluviitaleaceae bacterium]|nr:ribonuclease R [Defluviitaleaceae bacterium]
MTKKSEQNYTEVQMLERKAAKVLAAMNDKAFSPMKPKALASLLNVPKDKRGEFQDVISGLLRDGHIVISGKGNISLPQTLGVYRGSFSGTRQGYGFVTPEDDGVTARYGDIFIPAAHTRDALNKDTVLCRIVSADSAGRRAEGEILRVIKKGADALVGTYIDAADLRPGRLRELAPGPYSPEPQFGVFYALDRKIGDDIIIRHSSSMGARSGDKVMVKVLPRRDGTGPREGVVDEIIGNGDEPGIDVLSLIRLHGIPYEWSEGVLEAAERLPDTVTEEHIVDRVDLRDVLTVTIDGEDTKDVDDAVTIRRMPGGIFELGVHIADVAHYVHSGGAIDREARERCTSVYLADRVIPMLPPKLSNGICSLNAGCDRLALSCVMRIDGRGDVVSHEIIESVIHVDRGMTYTVVNDIVLHGENSAHYEANVTFAAMFADMAELAATLRNKRIRRGSIEFSFTEAKIIVNDLGEPVDIVA